MKSAVILLTICFTGFFLLPAQVEGLRCFQCNADGDGDLCSHGFSDDDDEDDGSNNKDGDDGGSNEESGDIYIVTISVTVDGTADTTVNETDNGTANATVDGTVTVRRTVIINSDDVKDGCNACEIQRKVHKNGKVMIMRRCYEGNGNGKKDATGCIYEGVNQLCTVFCYNNLCNYLDNTYIELSALIHNGTTHTNQTTHSSSNSLFSNSVLPSSLLSLLLAAVISKMSI